MPLMVVLLLLSWTMLCPAWTATAQTFRVGQIDAGDPVVRPVRYSLRVVNETNRTIPVAELWVHAPVRRTGGLRCLRLETSHPCDLLTDELGNQVLHFVLHDFAPYDARIVSVEAGMASAEPSESTELVDAPRWLGPEAHVESDHPEIRRLARTLRGGTPGETARRIFDWVAGNIQYAGYLREDRGALYALRNRRGDCTEYMALFVALCRAAGIPARGVAGYVVDESAVLKPSDYHNWAEFGADGIWKIADPQRKIYSDRESNYVATSVLGGESEGPAGHRFRVRGAGLAVRMADQ